MFFVFFTESSEDFHCLLGVWRFDGDALETPLKSGVLLDVFAVFVEGCGTDALDFTAREGGLEYVGSVDRAFSTTRTNERVQFVDEEDDVLGAANFVHHRLDALFKLAAVFRAGDHHGEVEHDDAAVVQQIGHGFVDDALRESFDDGSLADARLAEQNRVVLGATAEDLYKTFDLVVASDDWIEFADLGQFGQVAAETVKRRCLALAASRGGG